MKKKWILILSALLICVFLSACANLNHSQSSVEPPDPNELTTQQVFEALKEKFVLPNAVLTETGQSELIYQESELVGLEYADIGEEHIYLSFYRFPSKAAADAGAETIDENGNVGIMNIDWVDVPYFFKKDRLIAVYVGQNQEVIDVISSLMGEPVVIGPEAAE